MGRKPSIFSKNYKKKLRRRKRRIITTVIACIAVVAAGAVFIIKNMNVIPEAENKKELAQEVNNNSESPATNDGNNDEEQEASNIKSDEFTLESGNKITVTYKVENGISKIQMVDGGHSVKTSVSPDNDEVFLCDDDTKDIYILNKDKKIEKVTNPKYVASNNGGTFTKESVMAGNSDYKWVDDGKFIDENHIAYTSALPWFNKENMLYLWIYDMEDGTHKGCFAVRGKEFEFGEVNESGIKIVVDGIDVIVNKDGNIAQ